MKRHHLIAVLGMVFIVAGMLVLWTPVLAQEDPIVTNPAPPEILTGFYDAWVNSPHADVEAEAFNHWNEDDPVEIPASCAQCHSTSGYQDYVGADGTDAGVVDAAHAVGSTITCDACHNSSASHLTSVTFPSGVELTDLDGSARCMVCHQGRASGLSVASAIADTGLTDMNEVSEDLRFINIHYYAAASSLYGGEVHAGYEFEGERYQLRNDHVEGYDTCINCHNPHTLELKVEECATCHEDVESVEDLTGIRMQGSLIDYDGDGDTREGIAGEIETLQEMLYQAIQTYAVEVLDTTVAYDSSAYPYWFTEDGERYGTFSPYMQIATYNYQVSKKDPGAYAHNPKYHIEILFDTISVLNEQIESQVDMSMANRNDPGHFDATGEPFRHWDEDGEVSASCVKCHTATGLPFFLENGVTVAMEPTNGLACSTCHDNVEEGEFSLYQSDEVVFPSGAVISFGEEEPANLCINCHQGRESTVSVNAAITRASVGDDDVSEDLSFRNPHYFAAGATLFGGEAQGGYQYADAEYVGQFTHARRVDTCVGCHSPHALTFEVDDCAECHDGVETLEDIPNIRQEDEDVEPVDYDGDGDATEPIRAEIESFEEALYGAIQSYAADTAGTEIEYNPGRYPYWFDGEGERFSAWTPRLLRAAYNYTYSHKDPGVYAHNADYVLQLLYDSTMDIGGEDAVAGFTRPSAMDE